MTWFKNPMALLFVAVVAVIFVNWLPPLSSPSLTTYYTQWESLAAEDKLWWVVVVTLIAIAIYGGIRYGKGGSIWITRIAISLMVLLFILGPQSLLEIRELLQRMITALSSEPNELTKKAEVSTTNTNQSVFRVVTVSGQTIAPANREPSERVTIPLGHCLRWGGGLGTRWGYESGYGNKATSMAKNYKPGRENPNGSWVSFVSLTGNPEIVQWQTAPLSHKVCKKKRAV